MNRKVKSNIKAVSTIIGVILLISMLTAFIAGIQLWLNSEVSEGIIDEDAFDIYLEGEDEINIGLPPEINDYINVSEPPPSENNIPVANDDYVTISEDSTGEDIYVLANDNDPDGDDINITNVTTQPDNGTATYTAETDYINYMPTADYSGTDEFDYTIWDGNGGFDTATVYITVNPENDAPIANDDNAIVMENSANNQINVLANDTDTDGDGLDIIGVSIPSNGTATYNANFVYYTPNSEFNGLDQFEYTITDNNDGFDSATIYITVDPSNDPLPDVKIWDNDNSEWTDVFGNGDPIDTNAEHSASNPQLSVDSLGRVYMVYYQNDGSNTHIYLSRYDGTDVKIWDNDNSEWTDTFTEGDPIDTNAPQGAFSSQIAIDSQDRVYITYFQFDGSNDHIYLSRYDGTDVKIWDNDNSEWTDTFTEGDPIDTNAPKGAYSPQIAVDSQDQVYITYYQYDDNFYQQIYLSRYDGTDVKIWDNDNSEWTDTFTDGDPIDTNVAQKSAYDPQIAVDSQDRVYITYYQYVTFIRHIFLNRYDGTDVKIWDNDNSEWTDTFTDGDPIDMDATNDATNPQIAVDSQDMVYVTYRQFYDFKYHIYISRYNDTDPSVKIWDNDNSEWTNNFADGDPIDTNAPQPAYYPQIIVDSQDRVYVTYRQFDGSNYHIYLSRYDGTDVKIWDNDTSKWTDTFTDGDPIDTNAIQNAYYPEMAVDSQDRVYVTYRQFDGSNYHIYLNRYNDTDPSVKIWDNDNSEWTDTFTDGDPIDTNALRHANFPQITVGSQDHVYIIYGQDDGSNDHIYLSRY